MSSVSFKQLLDFVRPFMSQIALDATTQQQTYAMASVQQKKVREATKITVFGRFATVVAPLSTKQMQETVQPAVNSATNVGKLDTLRLFAVNNSPQRLARRKPLSPL
ncbi:hypothetical protein MTO96_017135 [Rhipicephalus appendiculatus]